MHTSCIARIFNTKSLVSKGFVLAFICFLAAVLWSASILSVSSYGKRFRLSKTTSFSDTRSSHALSLFPDGDEHYLLPEGFARTPISSDGETSNHQNSAVDYGRQGIESCTVKGALMRIYMYDLPPEFHFGMISARSDEQLWPLNASEIPRYPGGLNQQHSPEYWLTADLLTSTSPGRHNPCTVVRVKDRKLADAFFVPFFSSLSYNKYSRVGQKEADSNEVLQQRIVKILLTQEAWKRSEGRDHIIPMHHPNSLKSARQFLQNAIFIVADFGRYSKQVANMEKDVVAPYKHIVPYFHRDNTSFDSRKILLFFQGAIVRKEGGMIRQKLLEILKNEDQVRFTTGNIQQNGIQSATQGMRSSKFCLHLAGDTPSSNRLFDAIASHCVPVIISDEIELPFEDQLDYSEFCLFVQSSDALKKGFLLKLLKNITRNEWTSMWHKLNQVAHHFEFLHPTQPDDAVHMTWKAIARKLASINLLIHKAKRYQKSSFIN